MTLDHANRILDRIREGYPMSLAITTQALQRTGDIPDFPDKPLRTNGDEPKDDRTGETQNSRLKAAMHKACSSASTQEDLLRAKTFEDIKQHIADLQQ